MPEIQTLPDGIEIRGDAAFLCEADLDALITLARPLPTDERITALIVRDEERVEVISSGMGYGTTIFARRTSDGWEETGRSNWLT
jgi:hypothetical protein